MAPVAQISSEPAHQTASADHWAYSCSVMRRRSSWACWGTTLSFSDSWTAYLYSRSRAHTGMGGGIPTSKCPKLGSRPDTITHSTNFQWGRFYHTWWVLPIRPQSEYVSYQHPDFSSAKFFTSFVLLTIVKVSRTSYGLYLHTLTLWRTRWPCRDLKVTSLEWWGLQQLHRWQPAQLKWARRDPKAKYTRLSICGL